MNLQILAAKLADYVVIAEGETPTPRSTFNPDDVGPGIESFLIAFILAVALLLLLWSMSRHLRRVQVRAKLNEEARRDGAAASEPEAAGEPDAEPTADPDTDPDPVADPDADSVADPDTDSTGDSDPK